MTTPLFTPQQVRDDAQNRVVRTAGQSGGAAALVTVGQWLAQQFGWSGTLPPEVAAALMVLVTSLVAASTNLARLRAK